MSLFGGVQVLNIVCSVIRTKLIALWIGPAGVGLIGVYNSAIEMISSATGLGIRNSSVRDISSNSKFTDKLGAIVQAVRRWSWGVGIFGALITLLLAPWLSQVTFGDDSHTFAFILLSVVILINAITAGEMAILQGMRRLKRLANASIWGMVIALVISAPLYYFWGIDSVVPTIVIYSLVTMVFILVYRERSFDDAPKESIADSLKLGGGFIRLGILMTISSFVTILSSYIFIAYLNNKSGTVEVGYYQAGYTLVNKYVGLIFASIGMEFYPRLASVKDSARRISVFVSQQIKLLLLILIPIISAFLVFRELIVTILYSSEFYQIIPFISGAIIATIFRAVSWCAAFVIIAKGSGKIYLVTELTSAAIGLALNILSYHYYGLVGLGVSFIVWYFIYSVITLAIYKYYYRLRLHYSILLLTLLALVVSVVTLWLVSAGWVWCALLMMVTVTSLSGIAIYKQFKH
ncbi:MAG: oligosaccharide flippase family protein [Bacteroidales bacterium]